MAVEGTKETIANLRKVVRAANQAGSRSILRSAQDLLKRSNDLAPQLTGRMISTSGVDRDLDVGGRSGKPVTASVFYKEEYALFLHEGMEPAGQRYRRGPVTRTKPGAGGKFLQRPFDAQKQKYIRDFRDRVREAIRIALR